jgi:hypothetical protein
MNVVDCGVAGSGRHAAANEEGAPRVDPNTTPVYDSPASTSSHERLTCTTRLVASDAAICVQDFAATHIYCRLLCCRYALLITQDRHLASSQAIHTGPARLLLINIDIRTQPLPRGMITTVE